MDEKQKSMVEKVADFIVPPPAVKKLTKREWKAKWKAARKAKADARPRQVGYKEVPIMARRDGRPV